MKKWIAFLMAVILLGLTGCEASGGTAGAAIAGAVGSGDGGTVLPSAETPEPASEPTVTPTLEPTAEPTPAPTPEINLNSFPFLGKTVKLDVITDDPEADGASVLKTYMEEHTAKGRYILLVYSVIDGTIPLKDIDKYYQYIALSGGGDGYLSVGYNVFDINFDVETVTFSKAEEQSGFRCIFDIPADLPLSELELQVVDDDSVNLLIGPWMEWMEAHPDAGEAEADTQADPDQAGAPEPVDNDAAAQYVRSDESIDGFVPGVKTSKIRSVLGTEDDFPMLIMEDMQLFYMSQGYIFNYKNSTGVVTNVSAYAPAAGLTAKGVGVGSSYEDVEAAYTGLVNAELSSAEQIVIGNESVMLQFNFTEGVVNVINLSY